jgi:mannitol/fructose-specific phosphotransferase system IIA component (Ntr-type)
LTPLSLAAEEFLGPPGAMLLSIAAILAFVTTGNGGILAASRNPLAMSRDHLLPKFFDRLSSTFGTPYVSILATCGFMVAMILLLDIGSLVKVASTMKLILFLLVNLAVLIMRRSGLQNYKPLYRSPLFPFLQVIGIIVYLFVIVELTTKLDRIPLWTLLGFFLFSVAWYFAYVRPRSDRESALVYMVRSAIAREIQRGRMEEELREIALERDEVIRDRFDHLVAASIVLDLPHATTANEMFRQAAEHLAPRLNTEATVLWDRFLRREGESSTQVQPGLAIPHVIVDGEGLFDVMLVRCAGGIYFGADQPPVTTVFILVGSADERKFHLQALMAVATIVQEQEFTQRWLDAHGPEELRDIVLLSGRQRDAASSATGPREA